MPTNGKDRIVITTNRGQKIIMTCRYAKKTPEGFWDNVYNALLYIGVFDDLHKK